MTTYNWVRTRTTLGNWTGGQQSTQLASLPVGSTLTRVRFQWGFAGTTSTGIVPVNVMNNMMTMALVTTVGNGSETVPDPISQSSDVAPPTQRWLWWETRVPKVTTWDNANSVITWENSPEGEPDDARGQVLAPSWMTAGQTLNLWATCKPIAGWDSSGAAELWVSASILVRGVA